MTSGGPDEQGGSPGSGEAGAPLPPGEGTSSPPPSAPAGPEDAPSAASAAPPPPPPLPVVPGAGQFPGGPAAVGGLASLNAVPGPSRLPSLIAGLLMAAFLIVTAVAAAAQTMASGVNTTRVTLTGCSGTGTSLNKDGSTIQTANAPSGTASPTHPFVVAYSGTVPYQGKSATVITNHHWHVSLFHVQVKSGGSKNSHQKDTSSGTEKVKDYLPIKLPGLYYISGSISGTGGSCSGAVWVKVTGSPTGTVLWIIGVVFAVIGVLLLAIGRPVYRRMGAARTFRRHPITGLVGGIIGGIGLAALVISYAKAPYGANTPWVILIGAAVLGLVWGLFGPRRGRRRAGY